MENIAQFFKPMQKSLEFYRDLYSKMQSQEKHTGLFEPMMKGMELYMNFFQPIEKSLESMKEVYAKMEGFEDVKKCFKPIEKGFETFSEIMQMMQSEGEILDSPYKDFYSNFTKIYEETVGKVLKVPTVGPAREAFEKYLKSIDASIKFYGAALDFYFKLQKPWMESLEETAQKARKILAENPEDLDTFKETYDLLIKTYEERFQEHFQTEMFGKTLENMLTRSLEFQQSYEQMSEEFLKYTPITTKSDMDDIYKELYNIKKKLREQSKIIKKLEEKLEGMEAIKK